MLDLDVYIYCTLLGAQVFCTVGILLYLSLETAFSTVRRTMLKLNFHAPQKTF